jgi:hypothetical protein
VIEATFSPLGKANKMCSDDESPISNRVDVPHGSHLGEKRALDAPRGVGGTRGRNNFFSPTGKEQKVFS